jgi:hypothetical protein
MKRAWIGTALIVAWGLVVWAGPPEGEKKVPLDKVPKEVMDTVKARFPNAKLIGASSEKDGAKLVYEVELEYKGLHHDVTLEPSGTMLLIEREIAFKDLPKKVQKTLEKENPKAEYKLIEEVIKVRDSKETLEYYEAHVITADKKEVEVSVLPNGKLKPAAPDPKAKSEKGGGFTDDFALEKADLVATGRNPYFILEPGFQRILEGGGEKHVITVLDETKMVDGVETRVVVEKETKNGKVVEISLNYYAISKRTNSVYYFGEHVDIYKNDKIVAHEGSWLSGVKKARFGLMMPGLPLVGARYQQEVAPGDAMDRAEIVSVTETVATPAGEFKNCLKVKETTPMEPGNVGYKYYAPGIGLVQDGSVKLVKHGTATEPAK